MKDYIIKLAPVDKRYWPSPIKIGDKVWDKSDKRLTTVTEIYDDKMMDGTPIKMIGDDESAVSSNMCSKLELHLCSNKIEEGDQVIAFIKESLDSPKIFDIYTGILTKKWIKDEYPVCEIDGKKFDLVSEGHTTEIYKIICPIDSFNQKWIKENMEFDEDEIKIEQAWDWKKSKEFEIGDEVEINYESMAYKNVTGFIKEIIQLKENEWSEKDQVVLTNLRKRIGTENITYKAIDGDETFERKDLTSVRWIVNSCKIKCSQCEHFH